MPGDVNTAPELPDGSHEHATEAPDRRGSPSSPISPSQQPPSLPDVVQLRKECRSARSGVTEHELLPHRHVELVHAVPWGEPGEADFAAVPVFGYPSTTSEVSAPAGLGSSRDDSDVSADTQRAQYTLGDDQSLTGKNDGSDETPIRDSPRDHHESIDVALDADETPYSPALVAVGPLATAPESFHFSDPSELALSMPPYPATIIEGTPSLCCHNIHAGTNSPVPEWQYN